jgi:hypothetical protein
MEGSEMHCREMRILERVAVSGEVLADREHAFGQISIRHHVGDLHDPAPIGAERSRTYNRIAWIAVDVQDGSQATVDAQQAQLPAGRLHQVANSFQVRLSGERHRGRQGRQDMIEALHGAAFLIDSD